MTKTWLIGLLMGISGAVFAQQSEIVINDDSGGAGAQLTVPVELTANNHNVTSVDMDISYDTAQFELRAGGDACGFVNEGPAVAAEGHTLNCSEPSAGVLRILITPPFTSPTPPLPEGELFSIRLDILGDATTGTYTLGISNESMGDTDGTALDPADENWVEGTVEVLDIAPNLSLSETALNFSAENGTTSSAQTVDACNDGNADGLTFSDISISGADATNFDQSNNCPASSPGLAEGDCCQIDTTFSPNAVDTFTASLDVTSSNGSGSVTLNGEGTAGPAATLAISPTSHDYGDVLTGESASFTFTVTNSGEAGSEASIDAITPPAGDFSVSGGTCSAGSTLSDGDSCTIVLDFAPATDGAQSGDLVVDGTDTVNSTSLQVTSAVQGTGVTEPRFSSDPAPGTVTLGSIVPGGTLDQDVVITNEGNDPLDASCGSLTDPDGVFTLDPDPADFTGIAGGASETFNVACDMPDVATYEATLQCTTNEGEGMTYDYTFRCQGQPLVIPTMQPWGLILLSLMVLAIGGFSIRFFRAG